MINLFATLAPQLPVGSGTLELMNGYWGGMVACAGS